MGQACTALISGDPTNKPVAKSTDKNKTTIVVRLQHHTGPGQAVIELNHEWAPIGAAHVKELIEQGYYNDCPIYRVEEGFICQWGIHSDPAMYQKFGQTTIKDDPVKATNARGTVTFAMRGPNTRSVQLFVNYTDNKFLDDQGFAPIGVVIDGMMEFEKVYNPKKSSQGAPDQMAVKHQGKKALADYPELSYITKMALA